ncbi:MAG: hypothetical protein RLN69_05705 [Woeseiaceae bacterium]
MSDYEPTIRIRRPPRVRTDGQGRSVWDEPVDPADELELVSTQALKIILESNDKIARQALADAANTGSNGVLARNPGSGSFEVIEDDELQKILDSTSDLPPISRPADVTLEPVNPDAGEELSLVSTQALRKILGTEPPKSEVGQKTKRDTGGGFDPYNSG